jgi:hypothetical protein
MRKLNKKQVRQQARSIILDLIDREVRNPDEDSLRWENVPDLDEEGFEATWNEVYGELRRIHDQLKNRWTSG